MRLLALTILVAVLAIAHSARAWDTAEAGYPGGTPFREACDGGVLVGLDLRQGVWMDGVRPICARIDDQGRFGPPEAGTYFGGLGGAPKTAMCRAGSAVRGVKITLFNQNSADGYRVAGKFVGNLHLICADIATGAVSEQGTGWVVPEGNATLARQIEGPQYRCGQNAFASGIFGAIGQGVVWHPSAEIPTGEYLVRFGLSCTPADVYLESGRQSRCEAYAQRAMARKAMVSRCGRLSHPHYSVSYQGHLDWCKSVSRSEADLQDAARDDEIGKCKTALCRSYAEDSVIRGQWGRACGLTHPHYTVSQEGHFAWCLAMPMPEVDAQGTERNAEIEACKSREKRIKTPGENSGDGPQFQNYCAEYADTAVAQVQDAARLRCGLSGPRYATERAKHEDWCRTVDRAHARSEVDARARDIEGCKFRNGRMQRIEN